MIAGLCLPRLCWRHAIEDACGSRLVDQCASTACISDGDLAVATMSLFANVMINIDGDTTAVGDLGKSADHSFDVGVVVLGNAVQRHERIKD